MNEIKGKQRAEIFLKLFREKEMTYKQIGTIYNLSTMMICKELNKYFKKEVQEAKLKRGWYVGKRKKAKEPVEYICKFCGKKQKSDYRYYTPKFCSEKCRSDFMKRAFKYES